MASDEVTYTSKAWAISDYDGLSLAVLGHFWVFGGIYDHTTTGNRIPHDNFNTRSIAHLRA